MALYDASEMRIIGGNPPAVVPSRYGERRRISWPALAVIAALHLLLVMMLDVAGVLPVKRAASELKVMQLSAEMAPPPPVVKAELPKQAPEPQQRVPTQRQPEVPQLDAPPPIVATPAPAPVQVAAAAPPPPAPVTTGPVRVSDLDAKAVTVIAPKYPIESRRKREQGTVVLAVSVTPAGSVGEVRIARSSGFERLDKAALDAVRRWRWSPTMRDGVPVEVRGTVDIPFILQG
jgi:protein TonB